MGPHSVLPVNENVLPKTNLSPHAVKLDFLMMVMYSTLDCAKKQLEELLGKARFEVVGFWTPPKGGAGTAMLFEAKVRN